MIPDRYALLKAEFSYIAVLGYQERIVAVGAIRIKDAKDIYGFSRLYLARPDKHFLVLLKREWNEEKFLKKLSKKIMGIS